MCGGVGESNYEGPIIIHSYLSKASPSKNYILFTKCASCALRHLMLAGPNVITSAPCFVSNTATGVNLALNGISITPALVNAIPYGESSMLT